MELPRVTRRYCRLFGMGFYDPEDANAHIAVFEQLFPLGHDYSYNFIKHNGSAGFVLQIISTKHSWKSTNS